MVKKSSIQDLEKKLQRLEQEKARLQEQQLQLKHKEKTLDRTITETKANYVTSLLSQSNTSLDDLKGLLLDNNSTDKEVSS